MFLTGLLGLIWGSFFNVCILRLPENQTVIWDRSH
ncbi:MAG: prepilin peptidase, partial [Proteobacteria bacterium]|nr:prepilin peptidase [Pseudomonadota bacterium]